MKLFVGNLNFESDARDIHGYFETYGDVRNPQVINDRDTGQSRGFGFVEMDDADGKRAIADAPHVLAGRTLTVNEAHPPKEPRPRYMNGTADGKPRRGDRKR